VGGGGGGGRYAIKGGPRSPAKNATKEHKKRSFRCFYLPSKVSQRWSRNSREGGDARECASVTQTVSRRGLKSTSSGKKKRSQRVRGRETNPGQAVRGVLCLFLDDLSRELRRVGVCSLKDVDLIWGQKKVSERNAIKGKPHAISGSLRIRPDKIGGGRKTRSEQLIGANRSMSSRDEAPRQAGGSNQGLGHNLQEVERQKSAGRSLQEGQLQLFEVTRRKERL